jgi:hypothetical protein
MECPRVRAQTIPRRPARTVQRRLIAELTMLHTGGIGARVASFGGRNEAAVMFFEFQIMLLEFQTGAFRWLLGSDSCCLNSDSCSMSSGLCSLSSWTMGQVVVAFEVFGHRLLTTHRRECHACHWRARTLCGTESRCRRKRADSGNFQVSPPPSGSTYGGMKKYGPTQPICIDVALDSGPGGRGSYES